MYITRSVSKSKPIWRKLINSTSHCSCREKPSKFSIPKAPFQRLAKEILQELKSEHGHEYSIQLEALEALQRAAEQFLVESFEGFRVNGGEISMENLAIEKMAAKSKVVRKIVNYCDEY
jgi:hypothetical protein